MSATEEDISKVVSGQEQTIQIQQEQDTLLSKPPEETIFVEQPLEKKEEAYEAPKAATEDQQQILLTQLAEGDVSVLVQLPREQETDEPLKSETTQQELDGDQLIFSIKPPENDLLTIQTIVQQTAEEQIEDKSAQVELSEEQHIGEESVLQLLVLQEAGELEASSDVQLEMAEDQLMLSAALPEEDQILVAPLMQQEHGDLTASMLGQLEIGEERKASIFNRSTKRKYCPCDGFDSARN